MRQLLLFLVLGILGTAAACSSRADVYQACPVSGRTDDCVDGAICAKAANGTLICQILCKDGAACPAGTDCNGVDGTNVKSCHPK